MSLKAAEKTGVNEYTLEISIDGETFEKSLNKIFNKNKTKISIPGFRKGKAPRSFIEKYYGENVFYDDALDDIFPDAYEAVIEETGISPVDSPRDFDIKSIGKDGVELSCKVTVKPEIKLGEYRGISAVKNDVELDSDEIENELKNMQKNNARCVDIDDRAVQNGDITSINFEGYTNGVPFEGGKAEDFSLTIGSGQFIPGFEEQIIGHSIGESFDINVSFPEDYAEELAGKEAMFKIKINSIQFEELPALDDDFAKDNDCETLEELKKNIENDILKRKQSVADRDFENTLFEKLAEAVDAEIPDCMIEKALDGIVSDYEYRMKSQGIPFETYLQYTGMDMDSFRDMSRNSALNNVKIELAIEKIVEAEAFEINEDELEAEYAKFAENYHMEIDKIKEIIPVENIKKDLSSKKAVDLIVSSAVVEKEVAEKEENTEEAKAEEADTAANASEAKPKKKPAAKKTAAKKTEKNDKAAEKDEDAAE